MSRILDAEDWKVIAVCFVVVVIIALFLILLAGAMGFAVALFEEVRGI